MKKSLPAAALGLIAVLIISCQYVPEEKADLPSLTGIRGRVIIDGAQDLSMCSIIAELQINGKTVSVIKEIGSSKSDVYIFSTVSDINGNFELMGLPEGLYTVTASKEYTLGSVSTDVLVTAQAITEIDIVLTATGSISGTVQLDSNTEALQGTFVYAEGTSYIAGTDYSGNFTIKDIPTGVYDIIFYHDGYTPAETEGVVVYAASDTPLDMVNLAYIGNFPVINTVTADPVVVEPGTAVTLSTSAFDPDGDDLTCTWTSGYGTFDSDTGNPVSWTATEEEVSCKITVTVSDGVNETTGDVIVVVVPAGILEGNAWRGDFTVETLNDLDFISHYDRVIGDLFIDSTPFTDLDPLENLTRIDGGLYIIQNSYLTSISGMNNVTYIGGDLVLTNNNMLAGLDGLDNIPAVGGDLRIISNTALTDLDNLINIVSVGGKLDISTNDSLTNLDGLINIAAAGGDLSINTNIALENLDGLGNLISVGGSVSIDTNDLITDLDGLSGVVSVGGELKICDNISLTNIYSLDNITYLDGNLNISGNIYLENLGGLSNITAVNGNLDIYGNDALTDLGGLSEITSVTGKILIMSNDALQNLDGLSNITQANGDLNITNNDELINLQGLSNVTSVTGDLGISSNDSLIDLDGLSNITSLYGALCILNNDGLIEIDALINISSIGGSLLINYNDVLENLNGLSNLTRIEGNLYIENNPSLPTSLAYELLDQLDDFTGSINISGNQ